jgi:hypothetical protein
VRYPSSASCDGNDTRCTFELAVVAAHASFERAAEPGEQGENARLELLEVVDAVGGDADDLREKHPDSLPDSRSATLARWLTLPADS